jgi:septal ring factor EnvC (AmiA/AmiB activator)
MSFRHFFLVTALVFFCPFMFFHALAQTANAPEKLHETLTEKQKQFEELEALFNSDSLETPTLLEKRQTIKDLRAEVQALADSIKPARDAILADLNDLGSPPQSG